MPGVGKFLSGLTTRRHSCCDIPVGQERPPPRMPRPARTNQTARPKGDEARRTKGQTSGGQASPAARWESLPENHDGETPFTGELLDPEPEALSYTQVLAAPQVDGGTVKAVRRQSPGENGIWAITITPSQGGDITVRLPSLDCSQQGAICIDGESLSERRPQRSRANPSPRRSPRFPPSTTGETPSTCTCISATNRPRDSATARCRKDCST